MIKDSKLETFSRQVLAENATLKALTIGLNEGRRLGVSVSVAIAGPSLEVLGSVRADNATPHSAESSRRKAQTAASTRRPTGWMPAGLAVELPLATGGLLTNVPGGVPIKFDGAVVAGLGIAGGTVEQDAQIAAAVLTALGAEPA